MRDIEVKGHEFTFTGTHPHIRQDGTVTQLHHWAKQCEHETCAQRWTFKTTACTREGLIEAPEKPSRQYSTDFNRVLCRHHKPKTAVKRSYTGRKTSPTGYLSRQVVSDAEIAEMRKIASSHKGTKTALYQGLALVYPLSPTTIREILAGRRR